MCHIPMALQNVYALLYEYRLLVAMNALGIKLDPGAQTRLLGLGRLLEGEGVPERPSFDAAGRRAMTRLPLRVLVRVSTAHGMADARLENLSGGGCSLVSPALSSCGDELLVSITAPDTDSEYVFPARVVWASDGRIGARFSGMPTRVHSAPRMPRAA